MHAGVGGGLSAGVLSKTPELPLTRRASMWRLGIEVDPNRGTAARRITKVLPPLIVLVLVDRQAERFVCQRILRRQALPPLHVIRRVDNVVVVVIAVEVRQWWTFHRVDREVGEDEAPSLWVQGRHHRRRRRANSGPP